MTKAIEESPGVASMMRWVLRTMTFVYVGVVITIMGYWVYDAITGDPNWIFAATFTGIVGAMKGVTEFAKVFQKKEEVKGEIEELKAIVKDVTV